MLEVLLLHLQSLFFLSCNCSGSGTPRSCLICSSCSWVMQSLIGTWRFSKAQAITRRKSAIRHQSFARSRRARNSAFTVTALQLQSLAGFFRLPDVSYQTTGHDACKVRVTGYLLWDDDHNGSADVGTTVQNFSNNGFYHPWRSTAWEIHPVMKIEVIQ